MQSNYTNQLVPISNIKNIFFALFFLAATNVSAQSSCPNDVVRSVAGITSTFTFNSGMAPTGFGCLGAQVAFRDDITINGLAYTESGASDNGGTCYVAYTNANNQPFFPISANFGGGVTDCNYQSSTGPAGPAAFLPVEFTRFAGQPKGKEVYLEWQTASELNNSHFEIARSSDGKNWAIIGEVDGAGTTQQTVNYEFTDFEPMRGANYYALLQVDFDGTVSNSNIIAVASAIEKPAFDIYPNPVSEALNIRLSEEIIDFPIEIYLVDAAGRLINKTILEDFQMSMNVSNLENGFYFLQVKSQNQVFNQRFLKN